jgi:hypothetical protein
MCEGRIFVMEQLEYNTPNCSMTEVLPFLNILSLRKLLSAAFCPIHFHVRNVVSEDLSDWPYVCLRIRLVGPCFMIYDSQKLGKTILKLLQYFIVSFHSCLFFGFSWIMKCPFLSDHTHM